MNSFNLAWFRPIERNEFSQYFGLSLEECKEPYLKWSNEYRRLTKKFLYHQHEHYFHPRDNRSRNDDAHDNNFRESWKNFERALDAANINNMKTLTNKQYSGTQHISCSLSSAFVEWNYERSPKDLTLENMKSLWFNLNIVCSSVSELDWLKSLDYRSGYLHTHHWSKVRAAILLVSDARCEFCSDKNWNIFLSYCTGDFLRKLHVHHLHYKNLGQERYDDLILLCEGHHIIEHSGKASN